MTQEQLFDENIMIASLEAEELVKQVGSDVKNVLDLFHVAYRIQSINAKVDGPQILDEALSLLQIDALNTAKLALKHLDASPQTKFALEAFTELKMQGLVQ